VKIGYCSAAVLSLTCLLLSAPAQGAILYLDGPVEGTQAGWGIYSGTNETSDTFTVGAGSTITGVTFGEWVGTAGTPTTLNWAIGSTSFSNNSGSGTGVTVTSALFCSASASCGGNLHNVYTSSFTLNLTLAAGTYWLTLSNAATSNGSQAFWDQTIGGASQASTSGTSSIPAESFSIQGTTPEPGSLGLCASGLVLALAAGLRHRRRSTLTGA